jgi:hypothetical protein
VLGAVNDAARRIRRWPAAIPRVKPRIKSGGRLLTAPARGGSSAPQVGTALVVAAALVATTAVQLAFARFAANRLAANTLAASSQTGAVDGVMSIALPSGETIRR